MENLVTDLQNALAAVQTALDSVNANAPTENPAWTAIQADLKNNGWTEPTTDAPTEEQPAEA